MATTLWLDLEDTIITPVVNGWHNFDLINVSKIKRVIKDTSPDHLAIFSFAIHNNFDLNGFNRHVRPIIESTFGMPIICAPTVDDDIIPQAASCAGLHPTCVSFGDICDFWGKAGTFKFFIKDRNTKALRLRDGASSFKDILLDDSVFNELIEIPGIHSKLIILNIDELP